MRTMLQYVVQRVQPVTLAATSEPRPPTDTTLFACSQEGTYTLSLGNSSKSSSVK